MVQAIKSAEIFKALGEPTRLSIILLLAKKEEMSSGEIAKCFTTSWATVSRHLNVLRKSKLIKVKRESQNVIYFINEKFTHKWINGFLVDLKFEQISKNIKSKKELKE